MGNECKPRIDANFPGGNIVVDSIRGDEIRLHPDLRDTEGHWFYWCFRVREAAGRTLDFQFTTAPVIGARGPAVSCDGGRDWSWMERECVGDNDFSYTIPQDIDEVRFSFGMPYVERDLNKFVSETGIQRDVLCHSKGGREVELLRVSGDAGSPKKRILLTCRHHACEMMANYVVEGVLQRAMSGEGCDGVDVFAVPFVDKDGVEEGDQGKNRQPHDHNRDYGEDRIYPETRAIKELVHSWSDAGTTVCLDLHCPWISGGRNEHIYLVGLPDQEIWEQQQLLGRVLKSVSDGGLPYDPNYNLPFGEDWNTREHYGEFKSCAVWAAEQPHVHLASTIEIPYANAGGAEVNQETARAFGHDLARALDEYLSSRG